MRENEKERKNEAEATTYKSLKVLMCMCVFVCACVCMRMCVCSSDLQAYCVYTQAFSTVYLLRRSTESMCSAHSHTATQLALQEFSRSNVMRVDQIRIPFLIFRLVLCDSFVVCEVKFGHDTESQRCFP